MLPPVVIMTEVVRPAVVSGVTESDVIRWIGVTVAVAGAILATPEGIASFWQFVKRRNKKMVASARRLLRLPRGANVYLEPAHGHITTSGRAHASKWQEWLPLVDPDLKIAILHGQVDILREQVNGLWAQIDQANNDLQKKVGEAEARVMSEVRQLASELRGERSQSSRVDARGFGPIALGIVLTGLPDELARVAPVGWLFIAVSLLWTAGVLPSWLRDYRRALI